MGCFGDMESRQEKCAVALGAIPLFCCCTGFALWSVCELSMILNGQLIVF